jgi:RecA-family ATPase
MSFRDPGPSFVRLRDVKPRQLLFHVEPLIPRDQLTIVYGEGGVGKSFLAAALAISIASGEAVVEGWTPTLGRVLVLDSEADAATWSQRAVKIAAGASLEGVPGEILYSERASSFVKDRKSIEQLLTVTNPDLVIIDSVGPAMGYAPGVDPSDGALRFFTALRELGRDAVLIDHQAKDGFGSGSRAKTPYGSVYKSNLARDVFHLGRTKSGQILVEHDKHNNRSKIPDQNLNLTVTDEVVTISATSVTDNADPTKEPTREEQLVGLLEEYGSMSDEELASLIGISPENVRQIVTRSRGRVIRVDGLRALAA